MIFHACTHTHTHTNFKSVSEPNLIKVLNLHHQNPKFKKKKKKGFWCQHFGTISEYLKYWLNTVVNIKELKGNKSCPKSADRTVQYMYSSTCSVRVTADKLNDSYITLSLSCLCYIQTWESDSVRHTADKLMTRTWHSTCCVLSNMRVRWYILVMKSCKVPL